MRIVKKNENCGLKRTAMCSRSLGELPCDVLHHITELLVEYHPKDSINLRRVNPLTNPIRLIEQPK